MTSWRWAISGNLGALGGPKTHWHLTTFHKKNYVLIFIPMGPSNIKTFCFALLCCVCWYSGLFWSNFVCKWPVFETLWGLFLKNGNCTPKYVKIRFPSSQIGPMPFKPLPNHQKTLLDVFFLKSGQDWWLDAARQSLCPSSWRPPRGSICRVRGSKNRKNFFVQNDLEMTPNA